jgi:3',5'-cyclic-AMP phosphodiesterase
MNSTRSGAPDLRQVLSWMHIGDLHLTAAGQPNHRSLQSLVAQANLHLQGAIDFVVLPGDNADDGTEAQFGLVRETVKELRLPLHILPGDHDFKRRNLDAFYRVLDASPLPKALTASGVRCLFLDVVSAGSGGPDFRLGEAQFGWLWHELAEADRDGKPTVLFMHAYPADLTKEKDALRSLIARYPVTAIDMGHTHYNELANDGRTIYAATRSTGQIEEGPVGFSMMAVDGGVVSWRFKALSHAWPFVLITSPADVRLITDPQAPDQLVRAPFEVRAKAWSAHGITRAACRINDGPWQPMAKQHDSAGLWSRQCFPQDEEFRLTVSVEDSDGGRDEETLRVKAGYYNAPPRHADGSDADAIGAWPEKGILGTQLGPNINGRKW